MFTSLRMKMPDEITIDPFIFEWDSKSNEMFVSLGEDEHVGTVEYVWSDVWSEFVKAAGKEV
jgi:hypothetical protein